jgi:hypothetical protein
MLLNIYIALKANLTIKALLYFWDPNFKCFTFENIDMTPTFEEYSRILDFSKDSCKVYSR